MPNTIETRLTRLEEAVRGHDNAVQDKLGELARGQGLILTLLTGNGTPERGIVVRVDRLEQADQARKWQIRTLGALVLGGLIDWLVARVRM
jgi:hypothetical protein